jgi:hypothetical protein
MFLKRWLRKRTLRNRANKRGQQIISGRPDSLWSKSETRNLIRINRICAGLKPFHWDGKPRMVRGSFECQVSLWKFGNVKERAGFVEAVRDLVAYNNLAI